ncbi:MAG: TOPRIM nucleotidyl transferase/hydrolase domain-containing protein [Culicoidibacterales bacterium]
MARYDRKNRNLPKRQLANKLSFLVEGPTEKYYFEALLKHLNYRERIEIQSIAGGGYTSFKHYFQKNQEKIDVCVVIADLDRAVQDHREQRVLEQLINQIEKENACSIFFLTNANIETWFQATLPAKVNFTQLNIKKADPEVFKKLLAAGATLEQAEQAFKSRDKFYFKKNFTVKGQIKGENLHKQQSNLVEFKSFLKFHDKI